MFNRSRRDLTRWFTLSMGSILILFASILYYQRSIDRLEESDRLLYRKARVMVANIDYEWRLGKEHLDLSNVPILGNYSPPSDSNLVYARWYFMDDSLLTKFRRSQHLKQFKRIPNGCGN